MFVNLSPSYLLCFQLLEVVKHDRLKIIISSLAFGILLSGVIYWVYSKCWQEHQVKSLNSPDLHSLFESAHTGSPVHDSKTEAQENEEELQEDIFDLDQDISEKSIKENDPIKENGALINTDEIDVDTYLGDLSTPYYDYSPFTKRWSDDVSEFLAEEKTKFYYENMFLRYEGVKAALEDCERNNQSEWINFCNVPFAMHHQATKDKDFAWELSISIDPAQRYQAWKILAEELESTTLCLPGRIHSTSSEKIGLCPPGKEISLFVLKSEEGKEKEWQQFLSLIASRFHAEGVQPDSRPLNCDSESAKYQWNAVIPCKGLPTYFNYVHFFEVLNDDLFMSVAVRYSNLQDKTEDTIPLSGGHPSIVKDSYYRALEEKERHNPLKVYDPFANLTIEPLI